MTSRPAVSDRLRAGARTGTKAFRHRNYRFYFGGQAVSLVGTWMQAVAQAWLVLDLTGDPLWLGVIAAAQYGPVLLFGLFAGVVTDALPKRRTMIATQTLMMALSLLLFLLVATGVVEAWMVALVALGVGVTNSLDMPNRQSFAIELVGRDDVVNAVALNSALFNAARVVGPAVAGILIALTSIQVAILVNTFSYLALIAGLRRIDDAHLHAQAAPGRRPRSAREVLDSLATGLRYVRATPVVRLAIIVVGLSSVFLMNFTVLIPSYARLTLGTGADGYGILAGSMGVGSTLAALSLAFVGRPRPAVLVLGTLVMALGELGMALTTDYRIALGLAAVVGAGGISMAATANTLIQLRVPDELRGRVLAVYTTVFVGSTPVGGVIVGSIASAVSVPTALLVGGLAGTCVALAAGAWIRRARLDLLDRPDPTPGTAPEPA